MYVISALSRASLAQQLSYVAKIFDRIVSAMIKDIPAKDANVCFVHVEKAGGTTLHDFFLQHLPRYWVMPPQQKGYG